MSNILQEIRDEMIKVLRNDKNWEMMADGYLCCPQCGALIQIRYKDFHIGWHERNNV